LESWGTGAARHGEHGASKFGAGDPGQWGLVLIFAGDLEEVEEVGCAGVDGD
jgi:hypothetical protein